MKHKKPTHSQREADRTAFVLTLMASPLEQSTKHLLRAMAHHPDPEKLADARRIYAEALGRAERERGAP